MPSSWSGAFLQQTDFFEAPKCNSVTFRGIVRFFPYTLSEWTVLARRYGERCPPYLVSTLTPKQTANCGLLILLRRRRRPKEVHMTEMKRKPILIPIDHGYGVRP